MFRQPLKFSLRQVLVIPFVLQILAVTGVTGYLSWRNGQQTIADLADRLMDETSERINDRLDSYLANPQKILQLNQLADANGNLDLTDFQQLKDRFWRQINVFDDITSIGFANEQGQFLSLAHDRNGVLGVENAKLLAEANVSNPDPPNLFQFYLLDEQGDRLKPLKTIPNYDPRQMHWYQTAQKAGKQTWTEIVPHFASSEATLFAVTPIYQNGEFQGVMCTNLLLKDISRFLNRLDFSPSGQTFILERSGELVASSTLEKPFINIEGLDLKRLPAIDSTNPLTQKAMQFLREQQIDLKAITEMQYFQIKSDRHQKLNRHFVQITPYQDPYGLDWLVVVILPESDFAADITAHTRNTLWLSFGAMGFAVVVGSAIAEWIARPIRQMIQPLRIVEIDLMAGSFNRMAAQLGQSFASVQTALKESEAKYTTIFHNCPDSISLTSVEDGRWIDVNDSFLEVTGYTREEIIDKTITTFDILVNSEQTEEMLQQLQTTGVVRNQEVQWRSKSGEIKICLLSCEIIELDGQSYVLSISKEIGDLKQTQAALIESEAKLRQLTENLPLFLGLRTAHNDRWLYVSPGFAQITGGTVQEMYAHPLAWQQYIYPPDREGLLATKPLPYPTEPWTADFRIVRQDGAIRWLRSKLYPIKDETGEIYRICTIAEDISDCKSLELALEASESKLNQIINSPIAAIVRIQVFKNQDWRLDYVSAGSAAIFGYTAEEFIADQSIWMAHIHPEDLETTILPVFEDIFLEKTQHFEYRFMHKDGSLRWLSAQFTAKYHPEEDSWFVNQMTVDISDRKQAEIALAHQKQREQVLNTVIQNIHQSLDLSTIFANATRGMAELMELDRVVIVRYLADRGIWRHISAYRHDPEMPDDLGKEIPDRNNPFAAQLKQNQVVKIENINTIEDPINQKLAQERPGAWLLVPISVNGNVWGSLSLWKTTTTYWSEDQIELARRITQPLGIAIHQANLYQQSQSAQAALKKSEARYRAIIEDQTELIIRYQADGTLTFVNQAYCRYFHKSAEELIGDNYSPVIYEDDRNHVAKLLETMTPDNPVVMIENRVIAGDEIRWTQWVNRMIFDDNGEFIEVQAVGRDTTEIKQAEIALQEAKEAAEAANQAKNEFLANMSHELRTPLNAIMGFSDFLSGKVHDPQHRNHLQSIASSGRHLLALINDILDLSKIEAGKLTLHYESINLQDLLVEVQSMFNVEVNHKNLLMIVQIHQTIPAIILFDEIRLRQILFNLVGNAVKFTEQGQITITLDAKPSQTPHRIHLEIQITDTGIGIAPEAQEKIFQSFVQSDGKTTRKYGGTGLGLAITKRLTDLLAGTITLTSELGKGIYFYLELS
jgi:PAS domain S-box-containing protein